MRILQAIEFFSPSMGGSVQVAYQTARHLAQRGHDVTLLASDFSIDGSRFPQENFQTILFPCLSSRWGFYFSPGLNAWVRRRLAEFDLVHLHNVRTYQNIVISRHARRLGIPYMISAHGSLLLLGAREVAKQIFDVSFGHNLVQGAAKLIAVSPAEIAHFSEFGIPQEKVTLVYNGLDLSEFEQLPPRGQFRRQMGIPEDLPLLLSLGRIHEIKGLDQLIHAFSRLLARGMNARLVIAGPDDGDLSRLKALAASRALGDKILFPGGLYGQNKLAALIDADLLAAPSRYEIFGLVPFESLLCGTPVVVTRDSGSAEILAQAGAGYTVSYGDQEALEQVLHTALTDRDQSQKMVRAGQAFARSQLSWPAIAGQLETIYHALPAPDRPNYNQVTVP